MLPCKMLWTCSGC